jgi:hypothetical protein
MKMSRYDTGRLMVVAMSLAVGAALILFAPTTIDGRYRHSAV